MCRGSVLEEQESHWRRMREMRGSRCLGVSVGPSPLAHSPTSRRARAVWLWGSWVQVVSVRCPLSAPELEFTYQPPSPCLAASTQTELCGALGLRARLSRSELRPAVCRGGVRSVSLRCFRHCLLCGIPEQASARHLDPAMSMGTPSHTGLGVTRVTVASGRIHPFPLLVTECCRSLGSCLLVTERVVRPWEECGHRASAEGHT